MGMTIVEYAKGQDELTEGIIQIFAERNPVLQALEFEDVQGGGYKYNLEESLPGIGFRGVNESWTPSTGVLNPQFEPLVIAGGELDVDAHLIRTQGPARRGTETAAKAKALALNWLLKFIKGDSVSNPREFDGLQNRLAGAQLIHAGSTSGGDAISLFKLDQLIAAVEGENKFLLMNQTHQLRLSQAARNSSVGGYVTYTTDTFGRRVMEWNGVPVMVIRKDNTNAEVLPFTETPNGGGTAQAASIYCVSFDPDYVMGIQSAPPDVEDLGLLQSEPKYRTRVEWDCGFCVLHPQAAARLTSGIDAAFVV